MLPDCKSLQSPCLHTNKRKGCLKRLISEKNIGFMKIVFKSISRECFNSDLKQMISKGSDEIQNQLRLCVKFILDEWGNLYTVIYCCLYSVACNYCIAIYGEDDLSH